MSTMSAIMRAHIMGVKEREDVSKSKRVKSEKKRVYVRRFDNASSEHD